MITLEKIEELVNQKIGQSDLFLVEILIRKGNRISVFIDSDSGVIIKDCVELSRFIEKNLDRETEDFEIEVSSAGLDRPLKLLRQFQKNIGNMLKIITTDNNTLTGKLTEVTDHALLMHIEEIKKSKNPAQDITLPFSEIKEAKIVIKINK